MKVIAFISGIFMSLFMATAFILILYDGFIVDDPEEGTRVIKAIVGALGGSTLSFLSFFVLTYDMTDDVGRQQKG